VDYVQAKRRRWFDIDREKTKVSLLGEREYDVTHVGYKLHMNDIAAAIGLGNLEDFPVNLQRRKYIAVCYRNELTEISGLRLLDDKKDRESSHWLFTLLVERREDFIRALRSKGIPASVVHLRIDRNSLFGGIAQDLSNQEKFNEHQVSIPVHSSLKDEEIELITASIREGW